MVIIRVALLRQSLERFVAQPLILKLFDNPQAGSNSGVLTEPVGGGYASYPLDPASWSVATRANIAEASYPPYTFKFDGTVRHLIYGSFLTDAQGEVLYVDVLDEPFQVRRQDDALKCAPIISHEAVAVSR